MDLKITSVWSSATLAFFIYMNFISVFVFLPSSASCVIAHAGQFSCVYGEEFTVENKKELHIRRNMATFLQCMILCLFESDCIIVVYHKASGYCTTLANHTESLDVRANDGVPLTLCYKGKQTSKNHFEIMIKARQPDILSYCQFCVTV